MLKKTFTYEDLDGNQVVDQYYFHLSKSDLRELQIEYSQKYSGFFDMIKDVRDKSAEGSDEGEDQFPNSTDAKANMYGLIRDVLIRSAGVRSADGRKIDKSDAVREQFIGSYAYETLLDSFCNSEEVFMAFLKGTLPPDVAENVTALNA